MPPSSHLHLNGYGDQFYATWVCPPSPLPPAPAVSRPTWESGKAILHVGNALLVWKTSFYRRSLANSGPTPNLLGMEQRPRWAQNSTVPPLGCPPLPISSPQLKGGTPAVGPCNLLLSSASGDQYPAQPCLADDRTIPGSV